MSATLKFRPLVPKIMLFGDSLTQWSVNCESGGWVSALQKRWVRRADVLNRGVAGWNSRWLAEYVPGLLENEVAKLTEDMKDTDAQVSRAPEPITNMKPPLLFATLWVGANDACLESSSRRRYHVPLDEFEQNMRRMAEHILEYTDVLFLLSAPPCDEGMMKTYAEALAEKGLLPADWKYDKTLDPEVTKKYAEKVLQIGEELKAKYAALTSSSAGGGTKRKMTRGNKSIVALDLHSIFAANGLKTILYDGIHFNAKGEALVIDAIDREFQENTALQGLLVVPDSGRLKGNYACNESRCEGVPPVWPWHEHPELTDLGK